jgi:hypothetical protein
VEASEIFFGGDYIASKKDEILIVPEERWLSAQGFEEDIWVKINQRNS